MNKSQRLSLILSLIKREQISTQEELTERLREEGAELTQATASRDIKELGLIKSKSKDGRYFYTAPVGSAPTAGGLFSTSVRESIAAGNILCVKCLSGMAQGVAAAIDEMAIDKIIGTIAGDDTIFILTENEIEAKALEKKINSMIGR